MKAAGLMDDREMLSLTVSGSPGTYHLTLTDAKFLDTAYVASPTTSGAPLAIVIQGR